MKSYGCLITEKREKVLMSADGFSVAVNIHSTALIKTANSFMLWPIWLEVCVCLYFSLMHILYLHIFHTCVVWFVIEIKCNQVDM